MKPSRILALGLGVAMGLAALPRTASAEQPDKWVSYVESTGSQWVDTGIIGRPNTKIEAKVEWMDLADSAFVACGLWSNDTRFYMCYCNSKNANYTMLLSQRVNVVAKLSNGWETRWEKNRVYNYTAAFSATNSAGQSTGTITVDGIGPWSTTFTGLNTGRSLYVFANNSADGSVGGRSKTRCYGLKIYQGPEDGGDMVLVRDFQPGIKDGKPGLYDAKHDVFYSSISGTELVCDENSEYPDEFIEYVESQGSLAEADGQKPAYIDTGIIGKAGTIVEFKETCLCNDNDEHCVIGARSDSNTRFFMWYQASGHAVGLGYGTSYWRPVTTDPTKEGAWNDANLYPLNYGDTTHARVSFAAGSQTFTAINDETGAEKIWTSLSNAATVNTGRSLYVFARNSNGTPDSYSASRLYFLKIWQDGNLVRDFRPCLENGVAGLYDDVSKRIFYSLGTPLAYNNVCKQSVKPKEVVFVEYIESDGNNTLDTGVRARTGTRAKGVMMWTAEDENGGGKTRIWNRENYRYLEGTVAVFWRNKRAYLGARNIKDSNGWFHMFHECDAIHLSQYGSSGEMHLQNGGADVPAYVGVTNSFDVTFADGSQTVEWNGAQVLSTNIAGTVDTGNNLCLFSSSHWRWRSQARCYGLEIWQDGVKVRDFKPCLVDGKGMLYDTVTESIYRPSPDIPASRTGKIVFTGEEKPANYVEYVETDGKVFIDTGVIGKSGTKAEFKETSMQKSTSEEAFLASYGGSSDDVSRCFMWYHAWGYNVGLGYGTYYRPKKNDPYTDAANSSDPDVYMLNSGDTTHARVSFAVGAQTFSAINDATGTETLYSSKTSSTNVDTGRTLYLFAKHDSDAGTPGTPAASRFFFLKIWQGDADGSNMQLVRNFKPVKLTNGLVVLWDFVNDVPYLPKSTTSPYNDTTFPVVGPDGEKIATAFIMVVR
jgi:hypothetical protein